MSLTHFDAQGQAHMVDVSGKADTAREAVAEGLVLMDETLVAVASPSLARGRGVFGADDWAGVPLLQQGTRPYAWREWFAAQGLRVAGDLSGPRLELFSMLAEAAGRGMGIALVPPFLVEDELARGLLVTVSDRPVPSGRAYRLIVPEREAGSAALRSFGYDK